MVEAGKTLRVLSDAIGTFDRKRTLTVVEAYARLVRLDEVDDPTPAYHATWIEKLNMHAGVHVVSFRDVGRLRHQLEIHGCVSAFDAVDAPVFDPTRHALVCTEPSVLSYLADNPDGVLGPNACVVSPHFKCALVWWTV